MSIKDMVINKQVYFSFYKDRTLWYETESGFQFPVPIDDVGNGVFLKEDKALYFMRWIRKHVENIAIWESERENA